MNNNHLNCTSGLQLSQVMPAIEQQKRRLKSLAGRELFISIAVSVVTGCIFEALAVYNLINVLKLNNEFITLHPGEPSPLVAKMLLAIFGVILGGVASGFLTYVLIAGVKFAVAGYKTSCIAAKTLEFQNKYENRGILDQSDIKKLVSFADSQALDLMLREMNLEQLSAARKALGNQKFAQLTKEIHLEQFGVLSLILSLKEEKNLEKIKSILNKTELRLIAAECPIIIQLIGEQLTHIENSEIRNILDSYYLMKSPSAEKVENSTKKILINGKEYTTTIESLNNCKTYEELHECFSDSSIPQEDLTKLFLGFDDHTINLFFAFLNQKPMDLKKENFLELIPLFDKLAISPTLVDNYILAHIDQYEINDLTNILIKIPECARLKNYVSKKISSLKLTDNSWKNTLLFARKINDANLILDCKNFVKQQIIKELKQTTINVQAARLKTEDYLSICEDEGFEGDVTSVITLNFLKLDFKGIYEFAVQTDNKFLLREYKRLLSVNKDEIRKKLPWKFGEIPEELSAIIYAKSNIQS